MADEPLPLLPHEERLPPRIDLWVAAAFLVFSAAILTLAWRMPTYTDQGGQIYTAPALVPSFYGVVIGLLSLWLAARSIRTGALGPAGAGEPKETGNSNARFVLAAALGVVFIVGLIGRMPFRPRTCGAGAPPRGRPRHRPRHRHPGHARVRARLPRPPALRTPARCSTASDSSAARSPTS
jgi:hypothetical protein